MSDRERAKAFAVFSGLTKDPDALCVASLVAEFAAVRREARAEGAAMEREACVKIADELEFVECGDYYCNGCRCVEGHAARIVNAIRARGAVKP